MAAHYADKTTSCFGVFRIYFDRVQAVGGLDASPVPALHARHDVDVKLQVTCCRSKQCRAAIQRNTTVFFPILAIDPVFEDASDDFAFAQNPTMRFLSHSIVLVLPGPERSVPLGVLRCPR